MLVLALSVPLILPWSNLEALGEEGNPSRFRLQTQEQPGEALSDSVMFEAPAQVGAAARTVRLESIDQPMVIGSTNFDLAPSYEWGYVTGLKQTLGALKEGVNVHQITQSEYVATPPPDGPPYRGNPDHVFWVDEDAASFGVSVRPTGRTDGAYVNPGGMVAFGPDGTLWYTLGGRAQELPLRLYRSDNPFEPGAFTVVLDDYETTTGSTAPGVNVHASNVMLFWRHRHSTRTDGRVMFQRYDADAGFDVAQETRMLGTGSIDAVLGPMGIEQVWSRFDPRFNYTFVSWTFYDLRDGSNPPQFGSHPFMYSDDDGVTWRKANGEPFSDLPLRYSQTDDIVVPHDHLALGELTDWQLYSDMGVAPGGVFWMAVRTGNFKRENESPIQFFRFNGAQWENEQLTEPMHSTSKTHAVGVTKDYLVLLYSEYDPDNVLKVRLSGDDGRTWTAPVAIRSLDAFNIVSWISFVQPSEEYGDNAARFFYSYYDQRDAWWAKWWRNAISWIKIDVGGKRGDCNQDGSVTVDDLPVTVGCLTGPVNGTLALACQCADLDADGDIDLLDWSALHRAQ